MPPKKPYTIDDFKIGESVVPLESKELALQVVSIDREQKVIICRLPSERSVRAYLPDELEKESVVRPLHSLPREKSKDDATEKQEE